MPISSRTRIPSRHILLTLIMVILVVPLSLSRSFPTSVLEKSSRHRETGVSSYTLAVDGQALLLDESRQGIEATAIKTSLPVFEAFGISADKGRLLYSPLKDGVPSGELYVEDIVSGALTKISKHLVIEAAWSPTNENEVAYTFSGGNTFGLAVADLTTGDVRTLVAEGVLADLLQWDGAGEAIYYLQSVDQEDQPVVDSTGNHTDTALSPRFASTKVGAALVRRPIDSNLPAGFPTLDATNHFAGSSSRVAGRQADSMDNLLYSFRTLSPDGSYEILGDSLLGPGTLYTRLRRSGEIKAIGEGRLLRVLQYGVIVRAFNRARVEFKYIDFSGQATNIGLAAPVGYNLPLAKLTVTQVGANYSSMCRVSSHTGRTGFAYDMQSSISADILASAPGTVVYTQSSITCNSLDNGSDKTPCKDFCDPKTAISNSGWGNGVLIRHADGTYTKYAHMEPQSIQVANGEVCQGRFLGRQGHTGNSAGQLNGCGDHLHFQQQDSSDFVKGQSIPVTFSDVPSNPLNCKSYSSGSAEVTTCGKRILIYGPSMVSGSPNEQSIAVAQGYAVTVADAGTWSSMTTAQFAAFDAIVFGDPNCAEDVSPLTTANANRAAWSAAITGPQIIIGTDPIFHFRRDSLGGARVLIENGINFAVSGPGTGLYVGLSCYYANASPGTTVEFLSAIGDFRVQGQGGCPNSVTITQPSHAVMAGLSNALLSNWDCSVHEYLFSYPPSFQVLATAEPGLAYIVARPAGAP